MTSRSNNNKKDCTVKAKGPVNRRTTACLKDLAAISTLRKKRKREYSEATPETPVSSSCAQKTDQQHTIEPTSSQEGLILETTTTKSDSNDYPLTEPFTEPIQAVNFDPIPLYILSGLEMNYQFQQSVTDMMDLDEGNNDSVTPSDVAARTGTGAVPTVNTNINTSNDYFAFKPITKSTASDVPTIPCSSMASMATESVVSYATSYATTADGTVSMPTSEPKSKRPRKNKNNRVRTKQKPGLTAKGAERKFVKHNYIDRAKETNDQIDDNDDSLYDSYDFFAAGASADGSLNHGEGGERTTKKKHRTAPFPLKLHMVFTYIQRQGLQHVASWLAHGRAFQIHDPDAFKEQIMSKFFTMTRLTSFHRQLNLYGFTRITKGKDEGSYYNEFFLRGKPYLTIHINRTKVKGTKVRAASSPDEEPDFYSMPFVNAKGKFSTSKNSVDAVVSNSKSNSNHASGKSAAEKETSPTGTSTHKSKKAKTSSKSSSRTNRNRKSTPGIRRKGGGYKRSTNSSSTDEDISSRSKSTERDAIAATAAATAPLLNDPFSAPATMASGSHINSMSPPRSSICQTAGIYSKGDVGNDANNNNKNMTFNQNLAPAVTANGQNYQLSHPQQLMQMQMNQLQGAGQMTFLNNEAQLMQYNSHPMMAPGAVSLSSYPRQTTATASYCSSIDPNQHQQYPQQYNHIQNTTNPNLNYIMTNNIPSAVPGAHGMWDARYQNSSIAESVSTSNRDDVWNNYRGYQASVAESGAETARTAVSDHVLDFMSEDICSNANHQDEDCRKELVEKFNAWDENSLDENSLDSLEGNGVSNANIKKDEKDLNATLQNFWKKIT